jgi:hypothetical protein
MLQNRCQRELAKEISTLTTLDLYFEIYGGEALWKAAMEKKYPKTLASNVLLGCPYGHIPRDVADPLNLPLSLRLEEPRLDTDEGREVINFFRVMDGLPPKEFKR